MRLVRCAIAAVCFSACGASHFATVAHHVATADMHCTDVRVTELNDWAYRADGCGESQHYRCWYQRHSMGQTQCCRAVATEEEATALFSGADPASGCLDFEE